MKSGGDDVPINFGMILHAMKANDPPNDDNEIPEYEHHPFMPHNSITHYFYAPGGIEDFPGYVEKMGQYKKWNDEALDITSHDRPVPVCINFPELINIQLSQERQWKAHVEFIELVCCHSDMNVFGYWYRTTLKARCLDTLCSRTAVSFLITHKPHPGLDFSFGWKEWKKKKSRLETRIKQLTEQFGGIGCIYLVDFTPDELFKVMARFPKSRIVGITTPTKEASNRVNRILEVREDMRKEQQRSKSPGEKESARKESFLPK